MAAPTFAPPPHSSSEGSRCLTVTLTRSDCGVAALAVQLAEPVPEVVACRVRREFDDCHGRRCPVCVFFGAFSTIFLPHGQEAAWTMIVASATNLVGLMTVQDDFAGLGTAVVMAGGAAEAVRLVASAQRRQVAGALVVCGSRLAAQTPDLP